MPVAAPPPPAASPVSTPGQVPTTPGGASEHEPAPESYLGDLGPEFQEMDAADVAAKRGEETPKRGADGKFTKPPVEAPKAQQDKPKEEKGAETPPEEPKPEEKKLGPFATVRKAKEALEKERDEVLRPKIQQLEAKVTEYERTVNELKTKAPDLGPVQQKLAAIEKENAALRDEIRFANYQKHPEYIEKYQKPLNDAWSSLMTDLNGFELELEGGGTRAITVTDITKLAELNLKQRGDVAREWFGDAAGTILGHVRNISELSRKNEAALEEAKKGAGEHAKKTSEQMNAQNAEFYNTLTAANTELVQKYSKWFAPIEGDAAGNEVLKKGFDFVDSVFGADGMKLTPKQRAGRLAVIRAKAAAHDRLAYLMKSKDARIAELEESLAEYEDSIPPTEHGGDPSLVTTDDYNTQDEAELRRMDRR